MTQLQQVGFGVAAGMVSAVAIVFGFGVEPTAMNIGVVAMICVSLAVALIQLFGNGASLDIRR